MYLKRRSQAVLGLIVLPLMTLGACATTDQSLSPTFGAATAANKALHAIPAKPDDKANRYIPADPSRQALAIKNYKANTVTAPSSPSTN